MDDSQGNILGDQKLHILKCKHQQGFEQQWTAIKVGDIHQLYSQRLGRRGGIWEDL